MRRHLPTSLREAKKELIGDSIERKRLVERLIELVRKDERDRVLEITNRARERAGER